MRWRPFLAGYREVFERSFGLDAARLRAGGDEMLRADGDVGQVCWPRLPDGGPLNCVAR